MPAGFVLANKIKPLVIAQGLSWFRAVLFLTSLLLSVKVNLPKESQ